MTFFPKFGNWFLHNSRNVFFFLIVHYFVTTQLGYNLVGGLMKYFLTGEFGNAISRSYLSMILSWDDIFRIFIKPTAFVAFFVVALGVFIWFFGCFVKCRSILLNWKAIFILDRLSLWLIVAAPVIIFFIDFPSTFIASFFSFKNGFPRIEEWSVIFTTFFFWLSIDRLYQSKFGAKINGIMPNEE